MFPCPSVCASRHRLAPGEFVEFVELEQDVLELDEPLVELPVLEEPLLDVLPEFPALPLEEFALVGLVLAVFEAVSDEVSFAAKLTPPLPS